jgi:hypothetical protein
MCQDCDRLHEELHKQAEEMFGLRRTIRNLTKEVKSERHKNAHLRKDKNKQHVRKGQKRGAYGRNG